MDSDETNADEVLTLKTTPEKKSDGGSKESSPAPGSEAKSDNEAQNQEMAEYEERLRKEPIDREIGVNDLATKRSPKPVKRRERGINIYQIRLTVEST